jgi:diacylglycerol kinase (ATP)
MAMRQLPKIEECLTTLKCNFTKTLTVERGHARKIAEDALSSGAKVVCAVGGDGTLHEVSNAVIDANPALHATLAVIPYGTGNDFARCVGLTGTVEQMCKVVASGVRKLVDVGVIEGAGLPPTRFLVAAGTGYIADTALTVNKGIRFLRGMPAYLFGAVRTLSAFKPTVMTLQFDGAPPRTLNTMLISISNVATTGGGMRIAPGALCDDGLFEICLVRSLSKWTLLRQLPNVIKGLHIGHPAVEMITAKSVILQSSVPLNLWIDGEVFGKTPAKITMEAGRLPILLPK